MQWLVRGHLTSEVSLVLPFSKRRQGEEALIKMFRNFQTNSGSDPPPPPPNNINTAHRGPFQVNVERWGKIFR